MAARAHAHTADLEAKEMQKLLAISTLPTEALKLEAVQIGAVDMPPTIRMPVLTPPPAGWQQRWGAIIHDSAADDGLIVEEDEDDWSSDDD